MKLLNKKDIQIKKLKSINKDLLKALECMIMNKDLTLLNSEWDFIFRVHRKASGYLNKKVATKSKQR